MTQIHPKLAEVTQRIIDGWAQTGMKPEVYPAGSVGPMSALLMMAQDGRKWND